MSEWKNIQATKALLGAFALFALSFAAVPDASAQVINGVITSPMGGVLCDIIGMIFGNLGRGIAVIAIITLGIGAMLGKISWGMGLIVITGISITFGSIALFSMIGNTVGIGGGLGCIIGGVGV